MIPHIMFFWPIYILWALNTGTCIQQCDLFYSEGLHKNEKIWRGFGKNAGEWTRKVEINKEEIPGSKRSMYGIYWDWVPDLTFAGCFVWPMLAGRVSDLTYVVSGWTKRVLITQWWRGLRIRDLWRLGLFIHLPWPPQSSEQYHYGKIPYKNYSNNMENLVSWVMSCFTTHLWRI